MVDSSSKIKSALLTIGNNPIATQTFYGLKRNTDLRCVIFSRRQKKNRKKWKIIKEFGYYYTLQKALLLKNALGQQIIISKQNNILLKFWENANDSKNIKQILKELGTELIIVSGFQHIISPTFYNSFDYCLNIHPSLLPNNRGAEPIFWGLVEKHKWFGITLHFIDKGIDTGDILYQYRIKKPFLPVEALVNIKLARGVNTIISNLIQDIQKGTVNPKKQVGGYYRPSPTIKNRKKLMMRI